MKILCTAPTFVPSLDGPTFVDTNEVIEVETDIGKAVVVAAKGLYVDKKDDPTKEKSFTASDAQLKAAKDARSAAKADTKAA